MAAVHLGVPREAGPPQPADSAAAPEAAPEAAEPSSGLGWAWAAQEPSEAVEAQHTSDFVFHMLQTQAGPGTAWTLSMLASVLTLCVECCSPSSDNMVGHSLANDCLPE